MTKEKLIEENQKLKNRIAELEKENNEVGLSHECNKLWEVRGIYERQIEFYQNVIMNLTRKQEEINENSY